MQCRLWLPGASQHHPGCTLQPQGHCRCPPCGSLAQHTPCSRTLAAHGSRSASTGAHCARCCSCRALLRQRCDHMLAPCKACAVHADVCALMHAGESPAAATDAEQAQGAASVQLARCTQQCLPCTFACGNVAARCLLVPPKPQPTSRMLSGCWAPDHLSISLVKSSLAPLKFFFL